MKCMSQNKSRFFYACYISKEPILDDYGNWIGEYDIQYDRPKSFFANISGATGKTVTQLFGENKNYDKVMIMDNDAPPIDEYSILWIDCVPELDSEGKLALNEHNEMITPHDYVVKKVAKSLNNVSIAVSKVDISG